jgi:hypothetical protein
MSILLVVRRLFRFLCAFVALAFGILALAHQVLGSEPIEIGSIGNSYYAARFHPIPYWWLWSVLGFAVAIALFAVPLFNRKGQRGA